MPRDPIGAVRPSRGAAAALVAALAFLGTACAPSSAPPSPGGSPVDGGTAVFGEMAEPREMNCVRASDSPAMRVCRLVADTLIDYGRNLEIVPRLAESFEASPDGTVLTFRLRRGVRWHDGAPFTARDVLYTVVQIRAPGAMVQGNRVALLEPMTSIEAPDDFTVVTHYRIPYALAYQAWAKVFILPAHLPFKPGEAAPADRAPVGTGPYRFARWDPQQQIVLEANTDYFAGRPHLDRLVHRYVPDAHTLALALKSGEVDAAAIPPAEAPESDAGLGYRIERFAALSLDFIVWNCREPRGLFADPRVRRAMSLALDREAYVREVTRGNDLPAVSSFHPMTWAHDPALAPLPHDPDEAVSLLASAGWRDRDADGILDTPSGPASFTLLFSSINPQHERIALMLQAALKPIGVQVSLQGLEFAVLREKVRAHAFEAAVYRWGLDADPDPFDFFHSSQHASGQNYGGYASAEVDRLAEEGRATLDIAARAAIYHRLERILRDEQPYTFIAHPGTVLGVSRRLRGLEVGPAGAWGWYPASLRWWIADGGGRREP